MTLDASLPADLRGPDTTFTRVAAGLSGAGVYRVDARGAAYVLKVSAADEPLADWRRRVDILRCAASAGLAPRVVHVDEERRAVVSEFVVDRGFAGFYRDPRTHEAALARLARAVRDVHALPIPAGTPPSDPHAFLSATWAALGEHAVPPFVADVVQRLLAEPAPPVERAPVLSHNDVNPTNLVWDGERLRLLDWDAAGMNDPLYDLAAISVFLRMDPGTRARLLAAYDDAPVTALSARFDYLRRMVATLAGTVGMKTARQGGYAGGADTTLDAAPSLGEFYQRLVSGGVDLRTGEGVFTFGLALVKESVAS